MTPITCPNPTCKHVVNYPDGFTTFNRGSDDFCPACDTPLFWVPSPNSRAANGTGSDEARWRLPGAGPTGQSALGSRACPVCHERNTLKAVHCFRCHNLLDPPPVVVQQAVDPIVVRVEPPQPNRDRTLLWLLIGVVVVALTMALVVWLGR